MKRRRGAIDAVHVNETPSADVKRAALDPSTRIEGPTRFLGSDATRGNFRK